MFFALPFGWSFTPWGWGERWVRGGSASVTRPLRSLKPKCSLSRLRLIRLAVGMERQATRPAEGLCCSARWSEELRGGCRAEAGPGECGMWWKEQGNDDVNYSVEMATMMREKIQPDGGDCGKGKQEMEKIFGVVKRRSCFCCVGILWCEAFWLRAANFFDFDEAQRWQSLICVFFSSPLARLDAN